MAASPGMCGIAGVATADGLLPGDAALVDRMLAALAHRGPDEQRQATDSHASIGARRLSIIDLETGGQPVAPEDDAIQVTQNGEIYNYVELRQELLKRGHRLRSRGDTEVIAHLYEEHGDDFVHHLRGMFAIAIWDGRRRRLVLARDRFGKKPIYWRIDGGRLLYGSELKALLLDPKAPRDLDRQALAEYLQYQYVPSPRTIVAGINKLPAATLLTWEGGAVEVRRYWRLEYEPKIRVSPAERREAVLDLMREAVALRLRSDVPVGLFLSGGMDSSTVLALAAGNADVRTFTIGFEADDYDERGFAAAVANYFGTKHTEEVVNLDVISLLPRLADTFDEPFGDSSAIPTFRLAEVTAPHVRVVLTGDGGDETFGGYPRYVLQLSLNRLQPLPPRVRRLIATTRRRLRGGQPADDDAALEVRIGQSADRQYVRMMSMAGISLRTRLLGDAALADRDAYLLDVLASAPPRGIDRLLAADARSYLPEDLLVKMDRATMASSLEARSPLLDHRLAEYAARLPGDAKVARGTTKVILREIAHTLMPANLVERPKYGFAAPLDGWFRDELGTVFRDLVLSPDAQLGDHLDRGAAVALLDEHLSGAAENGRKLWMLLAFELWARRWSAAAKAVAAA
jgi:asparagine synthase (glutamine-hydrolysing)